MPDFLIIGAARAGTTALFRALRQHPAVFMPEAKEPNFFCFEGEELAYRGPGADYVNNSVTRLEDYQALFDPAPEGALCGEASPLYLFSPKAPERIHHHIPQVKMVAILRNPAEQALSHYLYAVKQRIEPLEDFTDALAAEEARLAQGWQPLFGYSRFPSYAEQLERYFALFGRGQILVRTYEEFRAAPAELLAEICAFIGAAPGDLPELPRQHNAGGVPKSKLFQDFLMKPNPVTGAIARVLPQDLRWRIRDRLSQMNLKRQAGMPARARALLRARQQPGIERLEQILDRDLSAWKA
ncbi:sulfotransferase (plasmid) [Roseobacteraceae bacterium NS-SX3]